MNFAATRFCFGTPDQLEALRAAGVDTVGSLFARASEHGRALYDCPPPSPPRTAVPVYKRHVMDFLRLRCRAVFFDVRKLEHETNLRLGGTYPWQWLGFPERPRLRKPTVLVAPPSAPSPVYVDDARAIEAAIRASLADMTVRPAASPPMTASPSESVSSPCSSSDLSCAEDVEFPEELCCPVLLVPFEDPVVTALGHTYERRAIEDWLFVRGHTTDPVTGTQLDSKELLPDVAMRIRCDRLRRQRRSTTREP